VIGGKSSSSSSSIHERGEERKESKAKLGNFFSGRKFKEERGEVKKKSKARRSKFEGF
jgi:hypothetical protein